MAPTLPGQAREQVVDRAVARRDPHDTARNHVVHHRSHEHLVADRENDRIQVFDQDGKLLAIWPTKLIGPAVMYVDANDIVYVVEHNGGLVSVLTLDGERLAQWGDPAFRSCHGIWADSRGDLYVVRPGAWGRKRRVVKHVRVG